MQDLPGSCDARRAGGPPALIVGLTRGLKMSTNGWKSWVVSGQDGRGPGLRLCRAANILGSERTFSYTAGRKANSRFQENRLVAYCVGTVSSTNRLLLVFGFVALFANLAGLGGFL